MKKLSMLLVCLLLSSCVLDYSLVSGDYDDLYARRHYDWYTNSYRWYQYQRSYIYPSYWNPYPYERIVVTPMIVVPQTQEQYQTGKRPDRGSLPNHNRNQTTPRRGRN